MLSPLQGNRHIGRSNAKDKTKLSMWNIYRSIYSGLEVTLVLPQWDTLTHSAYAPMYIYATGISACNALILYTHRLILLNPHTTMYIRLYACTLGICSANIPYIDGLMPANGPTQVAILVTIYAVCVNLMCCLIHSTKTLA